MGNDTKYGKQKNPDNNSRHNDCVHDGVRFAALGAIWGRRATLRKSLTGVENKRKTPTCSISYTRVCIIQYR